MPPNVVTLNPFAAVIDGTLNVEYERAVDPLLSVFVGPQVQFGLGLLADVPASVTVFGVGLAAGVRLYLTDDAPRGMFLSPQFEAALVSVSSGASEVTAVGYAVTSLVGYQWLIADRFAVSVGIGGRYLELETSSGRSTGASGFGLAGRLSFGFAFGGGGLSAAVREEAQPSRQGPESCRFPVDSVQVCQSSRGYRFAIPHPGTCATGAAPVAVVRLTCEARDRPAYHACLDVSANWIPVTSWETCASHGWSDAPGDYVPPGRVPADGVGPGVARAAPPAPEAVATPAAVDPTLPPRDAVRAALAEVHSRAAECLPPGGFLMRITYGNDGVARRVESLSEPLPDEVIACFFGHARAVPLPPFTREQLVVTQRFTPRPAALPPPPPQ